MSELTDESIIGGVTLDESENLQNPFNGLPSTVLEDNDDNDSAVPLPDEFRDALELVLNDSDLTSDDYIDHALSNYGTIAITGDFAVGDETFSSITSETLIIINDIQFDLDDYETYAAFKAAVEGSAEESLDGITVTQNDGRIVIAKTDPLFADTIKIEGDGAAALGLPDSSTPFDASSMEVTKMIELSGTDLDRLMLSMDEDGNGFPTYEPASGTFSPTDGVDSGLTTLSGDKIYLFSYPFQYINGDGETKTTEMLVGVADNANEDIILSIYLEQFTIQNAEGLVTNIQARMWTIQFEPLQNDLTSNDPDDQLDLSNKVFVTAADNLEFDATESPSGQNLFIMFGKADDPADDGTVSFGLVATGRFPANESEGERVSEGDTVNSSKAKGQVQVFGSNNQMLTSSSSGLGDALVFTYVAELDASKTVPELDPGEAKLESDILFEETFSADRAKFDVVQLQGGASAVVKVTALYSTNIIAGDEYVDGQIFDLTNFGKFVADSDATTDSTNDVSDTDIVAIGSLTIEGGTYDGESFDFADLGDQTIADLIAWLDARSISAQILGGDLVISSEVAFSAADFDGDLAGLNGLYGNVDGLNGIDGDEIGAFGPNEITQVTIYRLDGKGKSAQQQILGTWSEADANDTIGGDPAYVDPSNNISIIFHSDGSITYMGALAGDGVEVTTDGDHNRIIIENDGIGEGRQSAEFDIGNFELLEVSSQTVEIGSDIKWEDDGPALGSGDTLVVEEEHLAGGNEDATGGEAGSNDEDTLGEDGALGGNGANADDLNQTTNRIFADLDSVVADSGRDEDLDFWLELGDPTALDDSLKNLTSTGENILWSVEESVRLSSDPDDSLGDLAGNLDTTGLTYTIAFDDGSSPYSADYSADTLDGIIAAINSDGSQPVTAELFFGDLILSTASGEITVTATFGGGGVDPVFGLATGESLSYELLTYSLLGVTDEAASSRDVIRWDVREDGNSLFYVLDAVDHDNTPSDSENILTLDPTKVLFAADADGDQVDLSGGGLIEYAIIDDVPVQNDTTLTAKAVHEDALVANAAATPPVLSTGNPESGQVTTVSFTETELATLVTVGADEDVTISLVGFADISGQVMRTGTGDHSDATGLTSGGKKVFWYADTNGVYGVTTTDDVAPVLGGATNDRTIFSIVAGDSDDFDVTIFDQIDNIESSTPGEPGDSDIDQIDIAKAFRATDFDDDSLIINNGALLNIENDVPVAFVPEHAVIVNDADPSGPDAPDEGFLLNFAAAVGADEPGEVVFSSILDGATLLPAGGGDPLTSEGGTILLRLLSGGTVLEAYVAETGGDRTVFTITLQDDDTYDIDLEDVIDNGAQPVIISDFGADITSGNPTFNALQDVTRVDSSGDGSPDASIDLLFAGADNEKTKLTSVNISTQGLAVNPSQGINPGETMWIDFGVDNDPAGGSDSINVLGGAGGSDDGRQFDFFTHYNAFSAAVTISQINSVGTGDYATVKLRAIDADNESGNEDNGLSVYNDDLADVITGVTINDAFVAIDDPRVTYSPDRTEVWVAGLSVGDRVGVTTADGFNRLEIENGLDDINPTSTVKVAAAELIADDLTGLLAGDSLQISYAGETGTYTFTAGDTLADIVSDINDGFTGGGGADVIAYLSSDNRLYFEFEDGAPMSLSGTGNLLSVLGLDARVYDDTFEGPGSFDVLELIIAFDEILGDPIDLAFPIIGTDEDGDSVTSLLDITIAPNDPTTLVGDLGNDSGAGALIGDTTDDFIAGNAGNDQLSGLAGDDILIGGLGADTLTGGADDDQFVFLTLNDGADIVTDFGDGADTVLISASGFGLSLSEGPLPTGNFIEAEAAGDANDYFIFNGSDQLLFDADGNGAGVATLIATFNTDIDETDIFIIA